jgi:D-glycero-alpha-D-manno-heptose-7-phosphate kinase
MIKAFVELLNLPLDDYEIARVAFLIERIDCKLQGGRQDQYSATFGGFNFMEFEAEDRVIVNPLRIKPWILNEFEASLVLFFTGASRESSAIIRQQAENVGLGGDALEGMHRLKENAVRMKQALLFGDMPGVAALIEEGWKAKKRTSNAVTNPEMDEIHDAARRHGALAGKLSGAGGGGFFMFVADPARRPELVRHLALDGRGSVEVCRFTNDGVSTWRTRDARRF